MTRSRSVKRRIEDEYEPEELAVDDDADYVGQMTIAFCAQCPTLDDECSLTTA